MIRNHSLTAILASLDISGDADHALFTSYEYPWVRGRRQLRTARVNIVGLSASL